MRNAVRIIATILTAYISVLSFSNQAFAQANTSHAEGFGTTAATQQVPAQQQAYGVQHSSALSTHPPIQAIISNIHASTSDLKKIAAGIVVVVGFTLLAHHGLGLHSH